MPMPTVLTNQHVTRLKTSFTNRLIKSLKKTEGFCCWAVCKLDRKYLCPHEYAVDGYGNYKGTSRDLAWKQAGRIYGL